MTAAAPTTDKARQEVQIMRALNRRIRSGKPFTVDSMWDRLPDISPADHKAWLGRQIQLLAEAGRIREADVAWKMTNRSAPHSRPARVWQGVKASDRVAA